MPLTKWPMPDGVQRNQKQIRHKCKIENYCESFFKSRTCPWLPSQTCRSPTQPSP
uniref:Uncharacterized protein n=1 Tax=Rhizophora mucronata TaxID=61149 RepID=A0A2P2QTQ6_RHIMU